MPRRVRAGSAGIVFHVLNRGVRKARLFETDGDYLAFLRILADALSRYPVELFAFCVMPNHFHFLTAPMHDGQLSEFMRWLTVTHSKRWHLWRGTNGTGHVYQGRFKAFPVQNDVHFLTACRYVERNALRAGLSRTAESWRWGSAFQRQSTGGLFALTEWPIARPDDWNSHLNAHDPTTEVVRRCVIKGRPLGSDSWVERMACTLALRNSLRDVGRPPKA